MKTCALLALLLLAAPALHANPTENSTAAPAMSAAEFDAYTRGKTFYYEGRGAPYGAEEYLDNNRVRWSFLDGKCIDGTWYMRGDLICFEYENDLGPECWTFSLGENGLTARFSTPSTTSDPTVLYEVEQSDKPLLCLGPEVGV